MDDVRGHQDYRIMYISHGFPVDMCCSQLSFRTVIDSSSWH